MLPKGFGDHTVCVIGLGYVGLTLAVVLAEAGFRVIGVEINPQVVQLVSDGKAPFVENGLDARLARQVSLGRLAVSSDWSRAKGVAVYIVTVGTPLTADGVVNLDAIRLVSERIAAEMSAGAMVVLRSTVKVGVSRQIVMPALESSGVAFDLAFCPERTVEGKALEELRSLPQIVGGLSAEAAMRAAQFFAMITPTVIRVSSLETAEMIKLVNNTQRDLLFAFANEIAGICDDVGVSAREVIQAGKMGYARSQMPLPGPVGGPCLEKDPYILAESTSAPEDLAKLSILGRKINEALPRVAIDEIKSLAPNQEIKRIAVVGLAFKGRPETSDLRGTLAIKLITELRAQYPSAELVGFDPAVAALDVESLGLVDARSLEEAAKDADLIIFQNNNEKFQRIEFESLSAVMKTGGIIYDLWDQFDPSSVICSNDVRYAAFGAKNLAINDLESK
jgi:UDP-N-acetyl-D-mannosaminuronic acid dehydrogenase